jgi:hypothetical protein
MKSRYQIRRRLLLLMGALSLGSIIVVAQTSGEAACFDEVEVSKYTCRYCDKVVIERVLLEVDFEVERLNQEHKSWRTMMLLSHGAVVRSQNKDKFPKECDMSLTRKHGIELVERDTARIRFSVPFSRLQNYADSLHRDAERQKAEAEQEKSRQALNLRVLALLDTVFTHGWKMILEGEGTAGVELMKASVENIRLSINQGGEGVDFQKKWTAKTSTRERTFHLAELYGEVALAELAIGNIRGFWELEETFPAGEFPFTLYLLGHLLEGNYNAAFEGIVDFDSFWSAEKKAGKDHVWQFKSQVDELLLIIPDVFLWNEEMHHSENRYSWTEAQRGREELVERFYLLAKNGGAPFGVGTVEKNREVFDFYNKMINHGAFPENPLNRQVWIGIDNMSALSGIPVDVLREQILNGRMSGKCEGGPNCLQSFKSFIETIRPLEVGDFVVFYGGIGKKVKSEGRILEIVGEKVVVQYITQSGLKLNKTIPSVECWRLDTRRSY